MNILSLNVAMGFYKMKVCHSLKTNIYFLCLTHDHICVHVCRDVQIKLEQPDDEGSNIILRMVDEINDASSSVVDIGSDFTVGIHDDVRDGRGDIDMVPHYDDPLQVPLSDDLVPTSREDADPSMSLTDAQPQV